ncbi:hypothetical protein DM02DRAFT_581002 [Periconia macrospinosa]|uniref:Methyltransferase type 11 domain-containing protein n=1 Tax=Periconia macrospinosa TaxID=97972 RepID=A0A2V1ECI5_9PLEO|nr:hypothetical protein DM02DRAFT_581002 [Periconia macrospinosa]
MFSADLSWTEASVEKVGERRERIAKDRATPPATPSIKSTISSSTSIKSVTKDKILFWTSNLKKAKSLNPIKSVRSDRPGTSRSTTASHSRKTSGSSPRHVEIEVPHHWRDPALQPAWTYSSSLSPNLPSGQPIEPSVHEVPELEADGSSTTNHISDERPWHVKTSRRGKDEAHNTRQFNPGSFAPCIIRRSPDVAELAAVSDVYAPMAVQLTEFRRAYSVRVEACQDLEGLSLQERVDDEFAPLSPVDSHASPNSTWKPPTGWDIGLSAVEQQLQEQESQLQPRRVIDGVAIAHNTLLELTRFQRFIRRMEAAGPKVILDRLKEQWHDIVDSEADEELHLEKQLWVLAAFQLQNFGRFRARPTPACDTGKILELYGNVGESRMPPYTIPHATFSHIRSSTLPSLAPSSELPKLLRECYRLLAPGGMLELRIMDAAPMRRTAGPNMRAWIEDRVSLNLEREFRCSKPCMLVPGWVKEAGFEVADAPVIRLPCAALQQSTEVNEELKALVVQCMWRNMWGDFVDEDAGEGEAMWWWEDDEVMQECLQRETMFECGVIFAHRR